MNGLNLIDLAQFAEPNSCEEPKEGKELRFMTLDELAVVGGGGDAVNIG